LSTEHAHDGSFACPYYEAVLVYRGVTAKVHLYTVEDLVAAHARHLPTKQDYLVIAVKPSIVLANIWPE
jgi:hypothetical protein